MHKIFISLLCCVLSSATLFSENITVIGVGKVGLCLALSFEDAGYDVLGVDISPEYASSLNNKTFRSSEPFVDDYLQKCKNFRATTSLEEGLAFSDTCFLFLSTTIGTEGYDYSALLKLLSRLNSLHIENKHLILCSTQAPGFIHNDAIPLLQDCKNVTISFNPSFIAQGEIFKGIREPHFVLIGEATPEIGQHLEDIYRKVCLNTPYMAHMSVQSAEITKLGLNCFLTAKISLANLIGDIADATPGANKHDVLKAIGSDRRIGDQYIRPGYGFGGPCFPRDNRAMGEYATHIGIEPVIFNATDSANANHAVFMAQQMLNENRSEYVFEDVTYKPGVNIIECSQKLEVARLIALQGKKVTIIDNENVLSQIKDQFGELFNCVNK